MVWTLEQHKKIAIVDPIFIEGLPGIGNVGKLAIDFIVEDLKAKKVASLFSYDLPNTVFVNDNNLVELPKIDLYHKKIGKQDFIFLAGDVPPMDGSYELCDALLKQLKEWKTKLLITTGGIGLQEVPEKPKLYITGTNGKTVTSIKKGTQLKSNIAGVVGPIIGVTGLLVGLAPRYGLEAVCILSETFAHPLYLEVQGAKSLIKTLDKKFTLGVNIKKMQRDIEKIERITMKRAKEVASVQGGSTETNYIG